MTHSAFVKVQRAVATRAAVPAVRTTTLTIRRMYRNGSEPHAIASELRIPLPQVFSALQKPSL